MTYLFDLFLTCRLNLLARCLVQFHFVITIISVNEEKGGMKKIN